MRVLCKHFAKTCSELGTPWPSGKGRLFLSTETTVPKPAGFSGHFFSLFLLFPFALPHEGRRKLVPSLLSGLISRDLLLGPSSWRDKERKGFASLLICWPGLLVYRTNLLWPCRTQSPDSNQKLWRSREAVLNTWVETPLVVKWSFFRGHLRPSKDMEICAMIHNSSKILVMK